MRVYDILPERKDGKWKTESRDIVWEILRIHSPTEFLRKNGKFRFAYQLTPAPQFPASSPPPRTCLIADFSNVVLHYSTCVSDFQQHYWYLTFLKSFNDPNQPPIQQQFAMPPDPWTHPTLRDFGFQNMDIPNGAGDPPSPSTDHSEALSDLYGDEPEVPWVDAIAELMPEAVVDHPETIWYTGLLGYCTCSKSISEERWGEFQAKFQEIVLKRWTYETIPSRHQGTRGTVLQYVSQNNFIVADEEAIDSIFEKSQEKDEKISFILVVHATPDLKPDPGNLDQFEGHYKIPLDKVGDFWEIADQPRNYITSLFILLQELDIK
ncbi:hypothetical protein DL95DRAFT_445330 [Leptodontidium sp. 2 PMI_412]|nr:hypothetical protein DL95DRAFT_445330 [Leptodontidium sp. 2 PMI_412]